MKTFLIVCFSFLVAGVVVADDKAVQKYRNYTPPQIKDLSEKERRNDVPMMYTFAAQRGLAQGSELLFGMELNRLMYPGLSDYQAAVKAFQSDLGDKPTGVLTVWQIHNLQQRAEMQQLSRVLFTTPFSSFKTDEFGAIQGTVILIDEKIAWPINHVRVDCDRKAKQCRIDQIDLATPDDKSWSQSYSIMYNTEFYNISKWDRDNIEATAPEKPNACRVTSLSFNFKTKEFYYITRNAGGDCELMGVKWEKLAKPRIGQIVDGTKVIAEEFAKIQKAAYQVLASEFRKKIDALAAKEPNK